MPSVPQEHAVSAQVAGIPERYEQVKARIAAAARKSGRSPAHIHLVAVTKYASIDQVRQLIELGQIDLGENHVQSFMHRAAQVEEFMQRRRQMAAVRPASLPQKVRWHLIGHLQRNKVRKVIGQVRLIHSVDSLRLAEEIQSAATRLEEPIEVLVQVNTSGEKSKFGVAPAAARHLVDQIDTMMNLRPRGIMCMAPLYENPEQARPVFDRCREVFEDIQSVGSGGERFDILSMGMSNDFEVAIECGANMVRIGTAIFGPPVEQPPEQA